MAKMVSIEEVERLVALMASMQEELDYLRKERFTRETTKTPTQNVVQEPKTPTETSSQTPVTAVSKPEMSPKIVSPVPPMSQITFMMPSTVPEPEMLPKISSPMPSTLPKPEMPPKIVSPMPSTVPKPEMLPKIVSPVPPMSQITFMMPSKVHNPVMPPKIVNQVPSKVQKPMMPLKTPVYKRNTPKIMKTFIKTPVSNAIQRFETTFTYNSVHPKQPSKAKMTFFFGSNVPRVRHLPKSPDDTRSARKKSVQELVDYFEKMIRIEQLQ